MANAPVIGIAVCPKCGGNNPVIWDGNREHICVHCRKPFKLKRQKLKKAMHVSIRRADNGCC